MNQENLGPAERIIQTLLTYTSHLYHGRPGMVAPTNNGVGVDWNPVTHVVENNQKVVYRLTKSGKKTVKTRVGTLEDNNQIKNNNRVVGEYRASGIFPEVATWMYRQIAEIYKLDNEFVARWASYAFGQEHRDLKVVLAAFLLCQARKGDPVLENGKVIFHDDDFRNVGEAMLLLQRNDGKDFNPKLLMRVKEVLQVPGVAAINRELGFGKSPKNPFMGRWTSTVEKWLQYREENPKLLNGLVKKAGFRTTVMSLARSVGYKPTTPMFFDTLRWKQKQASDGRRTLAIGKAVTAAENWNDLTEEQICKKIVSEKVGFKRLVSLVPANIGLSRAVVAAAMEAGSLSQKDIVILTPTLEALGLLEVPEMKAKWEAAVKAADDQRAANIAKNVKSKAVQETLQEGADQAAQKAVAEVMKDMRVYVLVDISGSMSTAIASAKECVAKLLQSFPLDKVHVAVFNTVGRVVNIPHASKIGVDRAFSLFAASGGTNHRAAVDVLAQFKPKDNEDTIFIWVGDSGQYGTCSDAVNQSGLRPMAFGFLQVGMAGTFIEDTATNLGIPCFKIGPETFDDVYAIPRTIRALVASTPVGMNHRGVSRRESLVETIIKTPLLQKPVWA